MQPLNLIHCFFALMATQGLLTQMLSSKNGASPRKPSRSKKNSPSFQIGQFRLIATLSISVIFIWAIYSLAKVDPKANKKQNYTDNTSTAYNAQQAPVQQTQYQRTQAIDGYSFYLKLKDFSIDIPQTNNYNGPRDKYTDAIYLIQTGSFKTAERAERQLVALKLLGLEPSVKDHINSSGNRWFRVTVGPFNTRSKMTSVRSTIISNGIDASVMKRKL